jgi:N-acetylmuramic acid 6-phosphate etherase
MPTRDHLLTELRLPASMALDTMSVADAVALMNQQDAIAVAAVGAVAASIAQAIELVVAAFKSDGRLLYFGAGTSGRLGVLDASECPPTFNSDPERVQGIIAGGESAMFRAKEGAEDRADDGAAAVDAKNVDHRDVVMGIAAGGTTPFVHGALRQATRRGAKTIFLSCVQPVPNEPSVDVVIRPLTGPEVLTGSTRLKAGTATKLILNTITTVLMVQMGKCYENLMVDLRASNEKLRDRAVRIVGMATALDSANSAELLKQADGDVKRAIVMHRFGVSVNVADELLRKHDGRLRATLDGGGPA